MNNNALIPIMIGITGHRDPVKEDIPMLKAAVIKEINSIKKERDYTIRLLEICGILES